MTDPVITIVELKMAEMIRDFARNQGDVMTAKESLPAIVEALRNVLKHQGHTRKPLDQQMKAMERLYHEGLLRHSTQR
jgi:hypothetical protein